MGMREDESAFRFSVATIARRDGIAMRACFRMAEEGADALIEFRADDVLKFAGLRVYFGFLDGKGVLEEALREAVAAHDVARALGSYGSELSFAVLELYQMELGHSSQNFRGGLVGD